MNSARQVRMKLNLMPALRWSQVRRRLSFFPLFFFIIKWVA
jgi:hypothetical protein